MAARSVEARVVSVQLGQEAQVSDERAGAETLSEERRDCQEVLYPSKCSG